LRYKIGKNLTAELVGSNLTNRYYLDPMSRSYLPAPGRTIRIGITGKRPSEHWVLDGFLHDGLVMPYSFMLYES
jgi:putative receptor protein